MGGRQRLVSSGAIGSVVSIATRRVGNVRDQDVLRGRTSIPLYYGVHDLDIVRWLAGVPAVSIQASRRGGVLRAAGFDIDDLYCAIVRFEGDILATAELGWHVPASAMAAPTTGFTVVGTQGWLRVEQGQTGLECHADDAAGTGRLVGGRELLAGGPRPACGRPHERTGALPGLCTDRSDHR